jgi:hypothetical protein
MHASMHVLCMERMYSNKQTLQEGLLSPLQILNFNSHPSFFLLSNMSDTEPFLNDQNRSALPVMDSSSTPQPHPAGILGLSIATSLWYFWILVKGVMIKDNTRWIWLLCFCLSCLSLSINAGEQIQILTNLFPAAKKNQALTTTKKEALQKTFLINTLALPIGLFTFAFSQEYSANFDKETKITLIGVGAMIFIPYAVVVSITASNL